MVKLQEPRPWSRETERDRFYGRQWKKARAAFLAEHPLCVYCADLGRTTAASVVDHIVPHRGNHELFWRVSNWQPLCEACHNGAKAELERTGALRGCNTDGLPVDPGHPWNFSR